MKRKWAETRHVNSPSYRVPSVGSSCASDQMCRKYVFRRNEISLAVGIMLNAVGCHVKVQNFEFLGKEKTLGAEIWTKLVSS